MKKIKNLIFRDSKKSKKSLKGMTLLEIIIAMVVLVIVSTLIAEAGVAVVTNVRTSKSVIEKVNYQSRYVTGSAKKYQGIADDGKGNQVPVDRDMDKSTVTFSLQDGAGGNLGKSITADVYAAPGMDVAYDYKDGTYKFSDGTTYDKVGNLKYFE